MQEGRESCQQWLNTCHAVHFDEPAKQIHGYAHAPDLLRRPTSAAQQIRPVLQPNLGETGADSHT
jgi:hypothetical protein